MKRVERECMVCNARRYIGDYDICTMPILLIPQQREECTICGNKKWFIIVITELKVKEVENATKQS